MAASNIWTLRRFGHFVPQTERKPWKVSEAKANEPKIVMTLLESGYLLVLQGQESLRKDVWFVLDNKRFLSPRTKKVSSHLQTTVSGFKDVSFLFIFQATVPLHDGSNSLKVQHKSDNLMIRFTVKGESHMIRMQFDGSSTAEAVNQCSRAVEKLSAYVPVTSLEVAATHPNQPPVEVPPAAQQACQRKTGQPEPEAVHGSVSIKRLTEHYLGETTLALPNIYSPCSLASGDLEPILRVCLLDPSFPAFVEKVQEELEKLQEE